MLRVSQGMDLPVQSCGEDTTTVRRALTSGFFPHAAARQPDGILSVDPKSWNIELQIIFTFQDITLHAGSYKVYSTGQQVLLHPSSVLSSRKPKAIVFDEIVHTTRHYARTATVIDSSWLLELAPHFFASQG